MSDAERLARAALSRIREPGAVSTARLVEALGAPALLGSLDQALAAVDDEVGVGEGRREGLDPARDLEQAAARGIRFVIPGDAEWPVALDDLTQAEPLGVHGGPPLGLWVRGPLRLDEVVAGSVAVVGARSATTYGEQAAREIGARLAKASVSVISGAAFGIDQAAHRGALSGEGVTAAVLACGVDRVYPVAHERLLRHLADHALVISELPPGCSPTRARFLARNRLIAALSRGTVVVEAAARSGALNTANWADRLSRTLMAVPGPVTAAQSVGSHQLIRNGSAQLVTGGEQVLELVGASGSHLLAEPRGEERSRDRLIPRHAQVLDAVPVNTGARVDSIARVAGLPLHETQLALDRLLRDDFVERVHGGWRLGPASRIDGGGRT